MISRSEFLDDLSPFKKPTVHLGIPYALTSSILSLALSAAALF